MNTNTEIDFMYEKNYSKKITSHPLEQFLVAIFEFQIALKMFHFQTTKYSAHKTADEYFEKLSGTMDKFFEVGQGIFGRISISKKNYVAVQNVTENIIIEHIKKLKNEIVMVEKITAKHSGLDNIKDEIKGDLDQLIYLLSFQ